ncbi:MAG TPA: hypothetical protein VII78_11860 [Myxococcota bacterium]|jgi:TRAP-type C4-dicarboxylate transport system permease small subunit
MPRSRRLFEHHTSALLPRRTFLRRVASFAASALALVGFSLALGASGYHWIGGLPWVDSVLNAAMILTGMGPVDRMTTTAGKLFAAGYALFSGLAFITIVAVLFAPIVHRFLHALHLEEESGDATK